MNNQRISTLRRSYPEVSGPLVLEAPATMQLNLHSVAVTNATTDPMDMGIAASYNSNGATFYFYTAVGTTASSLDANGTLFDTTNNNGFVVQSKDVTDLIAFNVSQASTGSPVYSYKYWNGSSFVAITPHSSASFASTGYKATALALPYDAVVGHGGITGLSNSLFTLLVQATTAPSQPVQSSSQTAAKFFVFKEDVESKQLLEVDFGDYQSLLEQGSGVIPFYATADAANLVEIAYQLNP